MRENESSESLLFLRIYLSILELWYAYNQQLWTADTPSYEISLRVYIAMAVL